jgi:pyruvate kinase
MNMPGAKLSIPPLTDKDIRDLEFAVKEGVEYVALSFVGSAEHVEDLRKRIAELEEDEMKRPHIIVKIEKQDALDNLDAIIDATDCVMVARGDLATEVGQEKIGVLQKEIIEKCLKKAKPVIVATQMLESMIENPRPTRAEISDVANAVIDHTDATMLSGESANGKHPFETVQTMARIIEKTEESPFDDVLEALETNVDTQYIDMVRGVYELGKHGNAEVLLASTMTGETARLLAHFRPQRKLLVATNNMSVYRRLSLVWGVEQYYIEGESNEEKLVEMIYEIAKDKEYIRENDEVACIFRHPKRGRKQIEMKKVV